MFFFTFVYEANAKRKGYSAIFLVLMVVVLLFTHRLLQFMVIQPRRNPYSILELTKCFKERIAPGV